MLKLSVIKHRKHFSSLSFHRKLSITDYPLARPSIFRRFFNFSKSKREGFSNGGGNTIRKGSWRGGE